MSSIIARMVSLAMLSIFTQNAIFDKAFGSNVAIYASRKDSHVIGFSVGITAMTTISSSIAYLFDRKLLPLEYGWLYMPLIYVGIISVLYITGLLILWRIFPVTFYRVRKYAHTAIFNCTVFGALFLNSTFGQGFAGYFGYGLGTGIGFFVACFLLSIAHERLSSDKIPRIFRGYPIMLIFIGVISLAFNVLVGYTA